MSEAESVRTIRMLRFALAAIWTGLESDDNPYRVDDAQQIADEALELSQQFGRKGKSLGTETGLESWRLYLAENR